jgi:hypothetical protein
VCHALEKRFAIHRKYRTGGYKHMKIPKIYLDTSIIGYLYQETQPEKMAETRKLWELIKS